MATRSELDQFLAGVERRAFKQALFAVRDDASALDCVQEAMMKLSVSYGGNPVTELPMLFSRILQNVIRDWFRRSKSRSSWLTLFSSLTPHGENGDAEDYDPLETLEAQEGSKQAESAADEVSRSQIVSIIEQEVAKLPTRQREAFVLRYWEELDVAETAAAMGVTEGSVKTHCSRATHTLAVALKAKGITL